MSTKIEKETVKDKDDFKEALDFFNVDEDELAKKVMSSPKFDTKATDKIISIRRIAENYENRLRGKELVKKGDQEIYVQVGKALAGDTFIRLTTGIIKGFADESNLISNKTIDDFRIQFIDAHRKMSGASLRDRSLGEKDLRMIRKLFKDVLWNVGDIITNTQGNMKAIFSREDFDEQSEKEDSLFKKER